MKARLIAHYLPQFHPIMENDLWWGKGFTEWTNTVRAKPLFPGHLLPNIPTDLGFYDLRVAESREAQAELARNYGIEGFCYWHYWFGNGKRLLERPFEEVLKSGKPNFPFCLAWANHTWSGIWHGSPDRILIEQKYPGLNDIKAHFYSMLDAFMDSRYMKIDQKNIFCIYRPNDLVDPQLFIDIWRQLADKEGAPDFHFIGITDYPWNTPEGDYNGFTTNPPVGQLPYQGVKAINENIIDTYSSDLKFPQIYSYKQFIENAFPEKTRNDKFYPCLMPNWDNTPRSGVNGFVLHNSTPELYRVHLNEAINLISHKSNDQKVIFIKSWNEWAEGNYLEPDLRMGRQYLEVTKSCVF
jgi:lipopolysaccharide biosynthesis protein